MRTPAARAAALTLAVAPPLVLLGLVDPNEPGHYPVCPFRFVTGLDCPGCGSLRALHALTRGDVSGAVDHNMLLVLALPLLAAAAVVWVVGAGPLRMLYARRFGWAVCATVVAWAVVRNLPFALFQPLGSA